MIHEPGPYEWLSVVATVSWWGLSQWLSSGSPPWTPFRQEVLAVVIIAGLGGLILSFVIFALKLVDVSRLTIGLAVVTSLILMLFVRVLIRLAGRWIRTASSNRTHILLVADQGAAAAFLSRMKAHPETGFTVTDILVRAHLGARQAAVTTDLSQHPCTLDLQSLHETELALAVEKRLSESVVDEVVVGLPIDLHDTIEEIALRCARQGKPVRLLVDGFITRLTKYRATDWFGQPVLSIGDADDLDWHVRIKRLMDIAGSVLLLVSVAPLFAVLALVIKLDSPDGPAFFRQQRVGKSGRRFACLKFSSMVPDAEAQVEALRQQYGVEHPVLKLNDDPRITRVGKWLRRTSLDELPQLWNVLKGEMSLVGPRPLAPTEVDLLDPHIRKRLSVRPGLTCLWQISGRSDVDWESRMQLDLEYVERWSLWLDLTILARTIPAVLAGRGAY